MIAAVAATVVALLVFVDSENEPPPENLGAVADFTGEFRGEEVTVLGTVGGTVGATDLPQRAFTVHGGGEDDVVVVVPRPGVEKPPLRRGDTVVATGEVHGADQTGIIDAPVGLRLDLSDPPLDAYRDRAVIVAERISPHPDTDPETE